MKLMYCDDKLGHVLWGGHDNPYKRDLNLRRLIVDVYENAEHRYVAELSTGRFVMATGNLVRDNRVVQSPIYKDFQKAYDWADRIIDWARENYTGRITDEPIRWPVAIDHWTICPKCDNLNTLQVTQQAYGDLTECGNCDYSHFYDIGD